MNSACCIYHLRFTIKVGSSSIIEFFDIRGPERVSLAGDLKGRKECLAVNQSLSAIYKVVKNLASTKTKGQASFRENPITLMLKDALTIRDHQCLVIFN